MGYGYGIKQCRETLIHLASENDIESRLIKASSEMEVIESVDVSKEHFRTIKELRKQYLETNDMEVDSIGNLREADKMYKLKQLAEKMVWLCVEIIEHNSRNSRKQDT